MTKICNHYPMLTHSAGLRVVNSQSVIVKRKDINGELKQGTERELRDMIDSLLERTVIPLK